VKEKEARHGSSPRCSRRPRDIVATPARFASRAGSLSGEQEDPGRATNQIP